MRDPVLYQIRDHAAWITLNTPENRNALTERLLEALEQAVLRAERDPEARAIVLAAAGGTFCTGADLKSREGAGFVAAPGDERAPAYDRVLTELWESPKPVVGSIQGSAFGAGLTLMATMDVVVASGGAQFAMTDILLGLAPQRMPIYLQAKGILGATRKVLLTGERFSAEQAQAMGLVHEVVPLPRLEMTVQGELQKLHRCAPRAWSELKAFLRTLPLLSFEEAMLYSRRLRTHLYEIGEVYEGKAAFLEKRLPAWVPKD
jgi:enoyl-CoA hydratase/carnithine racemase